MIADDLEDWIFKRLGNVGNDDMGSSCTFKFLQDFPAFGNIPVTGRCQFVEQGGKAISRYTLISGQAAQGRPDPRFDVQRAIWNTDPKFPASIPQRFCGGDKRAAPPREDQTTRRGSVTGEPRNAAL
ncbi:hypothetical protein GCM10010990_15810 [Croceicoccus mobilis]|uniref:Uncharacterized protein n=1 Tax=Croceicoccus mobilis TaxID=1703339 RepID=A0A916YXX2_9SPHN|nr:hypothetical protein GCM10010990_15810 [Croceicoccus mobilis]